MTVHHIRHASNPLFTTASARNGDIFDLQGKDAGMTLDGDLRNTMIRFLGKDESATLIEAGTGTKIYDEGNGTHMTFTFGVQGVVTIYDFQHDKTGHITYLSTATTEGHLSATSDGHGGTVLTGAGLTLHLIGDAHVAASQHS